MLRCVRRSLSTKLLFAVGLPSFAVAVSGAIWLQRTTRALDPNLGRIVLAAVVALSAVLAGAQLLVVRLLVEIPIRRLATSMRKAREGDFLHRVPAEGEDELAELADAFNATLAAVTDLHARRLEDAQSMESMQRELALKAQVEAQHRLLDETNRRLQGSLKELTLLFDLARTLNSTLQLDELLRLVTELLLRNLGYDKFALLLVDEATGGLVAKATYGLDPGLEGHRCDLGGGAAGWAAREQQVLLVRDTRGDPHRPSDRWLQGTEGSVLAVPMIHKDQCVGVLDLFRPVVDGFSEAEVRLLQSVASQAAMAIANARLHQQMVKLSNTDALTGIANRRSFFSRLEMEMVRAEASSQTFALVMIDVDHFKELNDAWGHLAGDRVLKRVASLLASQVRKVDSVTRYGGEEFALILPHAGQHEAVEAAEKLRGLVESTVPLGDGARQAHVTISVGVASYPTHARELTALVDCADAALYAAKKAGRNSVRSYEPGMRENPGRRRDARVTAQVEPSGV